MPTSRSHHPYLGLLHLSFLFSGAGTLLLGPTLPVFAAHWHLRDSQSGVLIAAQFFGLFLGAIAISRNLRLTFLSGCVTAIAGFGLLDIAFSRLEGHLQGIFAFFLLGLGLGQITTTVNLFSALRFESPRQRSSALSLLSFTWSAGAVLSPILAGFYLAHAGLKPLLLTFAASGIALLVTFFRAVPGSIRPASATASPGAMPLQPLLAVFLIFFLYGGLEATLSGWLSTYTLRYTSLSIAASAYCTTALWAAFAIGRALAALLLRVVPERTLRTAGIALATGSTLALRSTHTGLAIGTCAACIGLGIAPFFPVTFSLLIARAPSPRQAGAATANIGLGSSVFPYVTGLLSTRTGSLQTAMITPIAIAIGLLALSSLAPAERRLLDRSSV